MIKLQQPFPFVSVFWAKDRLSIIQFNAGKCLDKLSAYFTQERDLHNAECKYNIEKLSSRATMPGINFK